jgi:hypothetical protein
MPNSGWKISQHFRSYIARASSIAKEKVSSELEFESE